MRMEVERKMERLIAALEAAKTSAEKFRGSYVGVMSAAEAAELERLIPKVKNLYNLTQEIGIYAAIASSREARLVAYNELLHRE